ncbi:uncharacterized protein [Salminus brasiliensis]|uniref:uncharacterized protein n=1 Tax=Salminus brasiliensis TaxID=930266 RepID=UPI003B834754
MESETVNDVLRLHFDFYREFYQMAGWTTMILFSESRIPRTLRTVFMSSVVQSYPIYERLGEMGVFSTMKRLYLRAMDIAIALAGTEEFQTFREEHFEKWKSFREELNRLADEERKKPNVMFPQARAVRQMFLDRFEAFVNKVNADIDDDTIRLLSINWADIRDVCLQKLLAKGVLTQDQLDEAERIYVDYILGFLGKYEQLTEGMDKKKAEDTLKALLKLVMMGFTYIYAPLTQTWDFVTI